MIELQNNQIYFNNMPGLSFYERQHIQKLLQQEGAVKYIFDDFIRSTSDLMARWKDSGSENVWIRNASVEKGIEKELVNLHSNLSKNITNYSQDAWNRSNMKTDDLVTAYIKDLPLNDLVRRGLFARNADALTSLMNERIEGKTVSQRVWDITGNAKENMEYYLKSGLSTGRPSTLISQDVRQLLKEPDKRFHRIRNADGKLVPSAPMRDYHPGTGVYRSSFMNAKRLAVTRTNRSYRTADHERWKGMDFIVGIDIRRSANNKGPCPICDALAGKYPKDYHYGGWHPFCICPATPILMEEDAFLDSLVDDTEPVGEFVRDIPAEARNYINKNDSLKRYVVGDNGKYFGSSPVKVKAKPIKTIKTAQQKAEIQQKWNARVSGRKYNAQLSEIKAQYGTQSPVIGNMTTQIQGEIKKGTAVSRIDDMMARLTGKTKVKAAWDERVEINHLETLLVGVKNLKSTFSIPELKSVYGAVESKLAGWKDLSLTQQKAKLEFEIKWVGDNKKYSTWHIAQDAYKKRLAKVEYTIEKKTINLDVTHSLGFAVKTKSVKVKQLAYEFKQLSGKDASISLLKEKAQQLNQEVARLEAIKAKKSVKIGNIDESAYSKARKDAALWAKSKEHADNVLRGDTQRLWAEIPNAEKVAATRYTEGSGAFNRPLRSFKGSWYSHEGVGKVDLNHEGAKEYIESLTNLLNRTYSRQDVWLQRGIEGKQGTSNFLGLGLDGNKLASMSNSELQSFVGKVVKDEGFVSCGSAKGTGFSGDIINIYTPRGTKMIYSEPFSRYNGDSLDHSHLWDGSTKYTLHSELETIIQRGTSFRITKIEKDQYGKLYIDCEVVAQP
ncbi:MAG: hypothetical protein AB2L20_14820 [Mangrovibacterium sp.]